MACVGPQSHGGDAGGDPPPPHRPYFTTPGYCFGSVPSVTSNRVIRKAFKANGNQPLPIAFDIDDLGTFTAVGTWATQFSSLLGELVSPLPFDCSKWEQIPEPFLAHIFPALETYFELAP